MEQALATFFQKHLSHFEQVLEVERLSGGASQETYRLSVLCAGQKKYFAFRRAIGGGVDLQRSATTLTKISTRQEAQLIEIARSHQVPEPRVLAICDPADGLGEGFVMEWLEGETLGKKILTTDNLAAARKNLAYQCGEILATIHSIPLSEIEHLQLPEQKPEEVLAQTYHVYESYATPRPMIDYTAAWLAKNMPPRQPLCLTHNDFRNGNLMVAPDGLVAVLDWELAAISDPMRDLGWLCAACWRFGGDLPVGGFGSYQELFSGYRAGGGAGSDGDSRLQTEAVKYWEVMSSFRWAIMCLGMAATWRSGADRSVERAAIGRRVSESEIDCANLLLSQKAQKIHPMTEHKKDTMPTKEELLEAVRDYLLVSRKSAVTPRDRFLALVGANSLDIVLRELAQGDSQQAAEQTHLEKILQMKADLSTLRAALVKKIKTGALALEDERLQHYLREQTLRQVLIDQPTYAGVKNALG